MRGRTPYAGKPHYALFPITRSSDTKTTRCNSHPDEPTSTHSITKWIACCPPGKGKINILHIGGSHVQAGYLSHRLRMNFSTLGDSVMTARGVIFPFRILRTNAPQNYRIGFTGTWESCRCTKPNGTDTLGLTGAAVSTGAPSASLTLRLNPSGTSVWHFTRLRILGYANDTTAYPYAIHRGDTLLPQHDAATHSYLIHYPEACDTAHIRIHTGEGGRFTLTGILPENDRDGMTYHAVGINGADVPAWLRCHHLPGDLKLIRPDLAVFGIGINDANVPPQKFDPEQFKARYRELIALFKSANPHCALLFVTNNDCLLNLGRRHGKRTNPNTARVAKAFKELAAETGRCRMGPIPYHGRFALFRLVARQEVDAPRPYTLHRRRIPPHRRYALQCNHNRLFTS